MKTVLKLLLGMAVTLGSCQSALASEETPKFAYSIESRTMSTNRVKIGNDENVTSCGTGEKFKVYRTQLQEQTGAVEGSDSSGDWGGYI